MHGVMKDAGEGAGDSVTAVEGCEAGDGLDGRESEGTGGHGASPFVRSR